MSEGADASRLVPLRRLIPFVLLVLAGTAFVAAGGRHYLTFASLAENREFAVWASELLKTINAHFLARNGIVAELYSDWMSERTIADEFWGLVFRENHPDADDLTRELARNLNHMITRPKIKADQFRTRARRAWKLFLIGRRKADQPELTLAESSPSPEPEAPQPAA